MLGMLVCAAIGTAGPEETEWTAPKARIPIEYAPARKGEIRQLLLYVSSDRGGTWTEYSTAQPGQEYFVFTATKSGPQWFVLVIESPNGDRSPPDLVKAKPGLKMFIRMPTVADRIPRAKD